MKFTSVLILWLSIVGVGLAPFAYATPHEIKWDKWQDKWEAKWEKKYNEYKSKEDGGKWDKKWDKWEAKWEKKYTEYQRKENEYLSKYNGNYTNGVTVPEPASLILLGSGLTALGIVKRRTQSAN